MTDHAHAASGHAHEDHTKQYVKIWGILLVLLVISFVGPMAEIQWLTLLTAFGIACVKAFLVVKYFMHMTAERKFVTYFIVTAVVFMGLFYAGVAKDVMSHDGTNWENVAAKAEIERALSAIKAGNHGHAHDDKGADHAH